MGYYILRPNDEGRIVIDLGYGPTTVPSGVDFVIVHEDGSVLGYRKPPQQPTDLTKLDFNPFAPDDGCPKRRIWDGAAIVYAASFAKGADRV